MDPLIRGELDQTSEWWDFQYRKLVKKQIPRQAEHHEDHEMMEERSFADAVRMRYCLDCGVSINDD